MKLDLEINNLSGAALDESVFFRSIEEVLRKIDRPVPEKPISVSLAIVGEAEIQRLNKEYRSIDAPTDVLSFSEFGSLEEVSEDTSGELFLGEIVLCYDDVRKYAQREKIPLEKELVKVFSHGVLHLLGFDHGEEMFAIQEEIADDLYGSGK